jgi:hypothetical protein
MSKRFPLAAVVAAAIAVSCSIPSRRIANFLGSMSGQSIPDEEGKHWQARMEGSEVIRLECQPGRPDYFEDRILLKDLDLIDLGQTDEDPFDDSGFELEPNEIDPIDPELVVELKSAGGLVELALGYVVRLREAEKWSDEDQAGFDAWVASLPEGQYELLFPATDEDEEDKDPDS